MSIDTKFSWKYLVPASDRFFNRVFQDEDTPVDGHEDSTIVDLVDVAISDPRAPLTVSASREPMPDGGEQDNPQRIRYCRIFPLHVEFSSPNSVSVEIRFRNPQLVANAKKLHLWFFPGATLATAGSELWLTTSRGDILLDGQCLGPGWTFVEKDLLLDAETEIVGLRLRVMGACDGELWMDGLRLGESHGFEPFVEPESENGYIAVIPDRVEKGGSTPVEIHYQCTQPLPAGARLELATPVGWMVQHQHETGFYYATTFMQALRAAEREPLDCHCGRKWDTRWRGLVAVDLRTGLVAQSKVIFVIKNLNWEDGSNAFAENRSFRLYVTENKGIGRQKLKSRPVVHFLGGHVPFVAVKREKRSSVDGVQPYFGYLHAHSEISEDGRQSPEECYRFGRDDVALDFCALSDHFWAHEPLWKWEAIQEAAATFNQDGHFVTFLGYEWSSQDHGDRNVYFAGASGPPCPVEPIESTPDELYEQLERERAIIIPHSPAFELRSRGINWDYHHPGLERLVEIYSAHGNSEGLAYNRLPLRNAAMGLEYPRNSVKVALDRSYKLGIIAGGDNHIHPNPERTGLAAVWAESQSREAIFQALYERRCYGTTGPAINVEFRMNDRWMGSIVECDSVRAQRHYRCRVSGETALSRIEWIKNGVIENMARPSSGSDCEFTMEWGDDQIIRPNEYSYLRGVTVDGHMFWSSPIWLEVKSGVSH